MKRLKICIIALKALPLFDEAYNRENVIGGSEINLYNLAVCFSRMKGLEVKVLVDDYGQPPVLKVGNVELIRYGRAQRGAPGQDGTAGQAGAVGQADNAAQHAGNAALRAGEAAQHAGRGFFGKAAAALARGRQLLTLDADAFIFTSSHPLLGKLVLAQRLLKGRKVIFRLSSDLNIELDSYRKREGLASFLFYRLGLMHASAIVSQTEKQRLLLKERLGLDSIVIPNGFFIRKSAGRREKRHILWVGRCMATKRPMLFIELARQFPQEEFVMIMPMNKEIPAGELTARGKLAGEVAEAAAGLSNLKLLDYVPYNEIQAYFDRAKLYVCTSELEGFPNTFIQACLGGTPILSYGMDPDDMIGKYRLGCNCGNDPKKAAAFIRGLSQGALSEYRERALEYASFHNNIYKTAESYLKLME